MSSALVYAIVASSVMIRAYTQRACHHGQSGVDLGDLLLLAILASVWIGKRQDPVDFLQIGGCVWNDKMIMTALVVVAVGAANFRAHAWLKQSHSRWMKEAGINPGGAYLALAGMPKRIAIALAFFFIASGALLEEILFRGFLLQWASRVSGPMNGLIAQAVIFGLVHGVPMALAGAPNAITSYALVMPIVSGIALGWLALESGGLAHPWLAHWALNYVAFVAEINRLPS